MSVPIGLEIEVPWRSYFPDLWRDFGLSNRRFGSLSTAEALELTRRCSLQEERLRPLLEATAACGVPRGNDRYWEFALAPTGDLALLAHQVSLLTACAALPRDRPHSLQITIGEVAPCPNLYYLLMALELRYVEPERILSGPAASTAAIHTGWLRKGRAGIHRKDAAELALGSQVACELRPLQLPTDDLGFQDLLHTLAWGVECVTGQAGRESRQRWDSFVAHAKAALLRQGLPQGNWADAPPGVWERFARAMPLLREELDSLLPARLEHPMPMQAVVPGPRLRPQGG